MSLRKSPLKSSKTFASVLSARPSRRLPRSKRYLFCSTFTKLMRFSGRFWRHWGITRSNTNADKTRRYPSRCSSRKVARYFYLGEDLFLFVDNLFTFFLKFTNTNFRSTLFHHVLRRERRGQEHKSGENRLLACRKRLSHYDWRVRYVSLGGHWAAANSRPSHQWYLSGSRPSFRSGLWQGWVKTK